MNSLKVNILNPQANKLLNDLVELNFISIEDNTSNGFALVLKKIRSKYSSTPSLQEITKEVELVRAKRYEK
jgi:hypothetical protein